MSYFPTWKLKTEGVIAPDERLPTGQTIALGLQHVVAMFGSTVLAPILMGFDPNLAVLMSGIGTLIFFALVGGHVPSYLGSSFAFIGVVIAATGYAAGTGANPNIGVALGGIIACGAVYALVGLIVMFTGVQWIEKLMPPVVTGAVVAVIGLNLAPTAVRSVGGTDFNAWMAVLTVLCVGGVAVFTRGLLQKLLILVGLGLSYLIYALLSNVLGIGGGQAGAMFLFRTFFTQQPASIFESAKMDGANDVKIFIYLVLPLAFPILLLNFVGTFSAQYNDYLWPGLVISSADKRTLMPVIQSVVELLESMQQRGAQYAIYVICSVPLIITTALSLKHFQSGDFASGMKL